VNDRALLDTFRNAAVLRSLFEFSLLPLRNNDSPDRARMKSSASIADHQPLLLAQKDRHSHRTLQFSSGAFRNLRRFRIGTAVRWPPKIAGFFSLFLVPQGARRAPRMLSTETATCTRRIVDRSMVRCAHSVPTKVIRSGTVNRCDSRSAGDTSPEPLEQKTQ
jgi:hypothetical protein